MDIPTYIPGITWKDVEEEAARIRVDILAAELGKAHGEITLLEDRLASARAVLSDTANRLHEEITNAEQAEERLASVEAYSADVIEADGALRQRVRQLAGFICFCEGRFIEQGKTSWAEEAGRVLRGEKG